MGRIRKRVVARDTAPWEGPFAPPAPTGALRIDPMVKTAGELAGDSAPAEAPSPAAVAVAVAA